MHKMTVTRYKTAAFAVTFLVGAAALPAAAQTLTDTAMALEAGAVQHAKTAQQPVVPAEDTFMPPADPLASPETPPAAATSTAPVSAAPAPYAAPVSADGAPPVPVKKGKTAKPIKAPVRPLPKKYLVVKKERDAQTPDARLAAARGALSRGEYGTSLELFNELYAQGSKDHRVLVGRAVSMQRLGQDAEAIAAYKEALNNNPKNLEALTNMLGLLRAQDSASALDGLVQLREIYPFNADITAQLGMAYGETGNYAQAIKYLDMAEAMKPGNIDVLYNRAVAHDHLGQKLQAAALYREVLQRAADEPLGQSFPVEDIKRRLAALR